MVLDQAETVQQSLSNELYPDKYHKGKKLRVCRLVGKFKTLCIKNKYIEAEAYNKELEEPESCIKWRLELRSKALYAEALCKGYAPNRGHLILHNLIQLVWTAGFEPTASVSQCFLNSALPTELRPDK